MADEAPSQQDPASAATAATPTSTTPAAEASATDPSTPSTTVEDSSSVDPGNGDDAKDLSAPSPANIDKDDTVDASAAANLSVDKLLALLKKKSAKADKLAKENEAVSVQNKKLVNAIKKLDAMNSAKTQELTSSINSLRAQLDESESSNKALLQKVDILQKKCADYETKNHDLVGEINGLKGIVANSEKTIQGLQAELEKGKVAVDFVQKEKNDLNNQIQNGNEELKQLKSLLAKSNKIIEEQKNSSDHDQKELQSLKVVKNQLEKIREDISAGWAFDSVKYSLPDSLNSSNVTILARSLLEGTWWFLVRLRPKLVESDSRFLRQASVDPDSLIGDSSDRNLLFWVSRNVLFEKLGLVDDTKISEESAAVRIGEFSLPATIQFEVETQLKEKFDRNWKTAALQYEAIVKDVNSKLMSKETQFVQLQEEFELYKKNAQQAVSHQASELEELKKIKQEDSQLRSQVEELKRDIESMKHVLEKSEESLRSVHKLENDIKLLEFAKEELIEKLQRSDTMWAAKVQVIVSESETAKQNSDQELSRLKSDMDSQIGQLQEQLKMQKKRAVDLLAEKDREIGELQNKLRHGHSSQSTPDPSPLLRKKSSLDSVRVLEEKQVPAFKETTSGSGAGFPGDDVAQLRDHIRKLQSLLREGEIKLTEEQGRIEELKNTIADIERSKKRSHINFDYLKNVLLGFMENPNEETLIPVLCRLLELSPEEIERVQEKRRQGKSGWGIFGY